jgi:hypothetical protein
MHVSRRYRDSAAECLLAAQEASRPRGCLSFSIPVPDRVEGTAGQVVGKNRLV